MTYNHQPLTPCKNITIRDNIVARSPLARKDMVVQIRNLEDATNSSNVVGAVLPPLIMRNNVYSVQGTRARCVFFNFC